LSAARDKNAFSWKNQVGFNRSAFFKTAEQNFRKKFSMPDPFTNRMNILMIKEKIMILKKSEKN
jgi:hypothetical protein